MTTDSGNKAETLAEKKRRANRCLDMVALEYPQTSDTIYSYIAALESTLSVLEALEAKVEAVRKSAQDYLDGYSPNKLNQPKIAVWEARILAFNEVLTLLKNAQRTASEGSEK